MNAEYRRQRARLLDAFLRDEMEAETFWRWWEHLNREWGMPS